MGEQVRWMRRALNLTQSEVATRAQCSQPSVARVERGEIVAPTLRQRIAAALVAFEAEAEARQ